MSITLSDLGLEGHTGWATLGEHASSSLSVGVQVSASDSVEDGSARENNLYVKNLPPDIDDARLERMFNVRQLKPWSLAPDIS